MFEDKRRGKKRISILVIGLMLLIVFAISYYINMDIGDEANSFNKTNENLKIPDSLKKISNVETSDVINGDKTAEEDFKLQENHKIKYITLFTICKHKIERETDIPSIFIGLDKEEFIEKNPGWDFLEVDDRTLTVVREIDTYCPRHFIIGLEGQYIAIYSYDEDGERVLNETTDINIETLTPEDQSILESGIVADTEDDLEQKLEGFSN
ncbi:BofC C-terminal domain-containing protein [Lutispora thermophila]|uniref:BofC C-terminal domain-containing protein n=1 Tax=Lutispora thermophila DSM 19022 TaxID=1122184 RepID=A0A1M6HQ48_9FIRM|nr:BofC C-terminal domain-containing protein [Lutispora thermophila]SHJ24286.1 BofC C-terminal domain-containing protein [Lutispora thermophila DSM 19022]